MCQKKHTRTDSITYAYRAALNLKITQIDGAARVAGVCSLHTDFRLSKIGIQWRRRVAGEIIAELTRKMVHRGGV